MPKEPFMFCTVHLHSSLAMRLTILFLMEMANVVYWMETFVEYLQDLPFTLYMDNGSRRELSHPHKKTYARFQAASLQYNFVIHEKTGSGVPLHLRTTSPAKVHAMAPGNPKLLQDYCLLYTVLSHYLASLSN